MPPETGSTSCFSARSALSLLLLQQACPSRVIPLHLLLQAWHLHAHAVHGAGLGQY